MGRVILFAVALVLAGCANTPPRTVTVEVPVAVPCPPPPATSRPPLPIAELTEQSTPEQVMRAYATSIEACAGYARELEAIIEGYRSKPDGPH